MHESIAFQVAEVVSGYDNTYKHIQSGSSSTVDKLFTIQVRTVNRTTKQFDIYTCKPFNINIKQIPLVGEHVLIFQAYNQETTLDNTGLQWYYFNPYSIQSSINSNLVPGISYRDSISEINVNEIKPGEVFKPKSISPLQPYEGDFTIEGRWGNTIRLSSTTSNLPGLINAPWSGDSIGDPIITIVNGHENKKNKTFVVEDLKNDLSSLYLSSTQKFPSFYFGTKSKKQPLTKFTSESEFKTSQLIGTADRIILSSKTDISVIDSVKAVVLNAPKVYIGKDTASVPIPNGDVLYSILNEILLAMSTGTLGTAGVTSQFIDTARISNARKKLKDLRSKKYFIDKG